MDKMGESMITKKVWTNIFVTFFFTPMGNISTKKRESG